MFILTGVKFKELNKINIPKSKYFHLWEDILLSFPPDTMLQK